MAEYGGGVRCLASSRRPRTLLLHFYGFAWFTHAHTQRRRDYRVLKYIPYTTSTPHTVLQFPWLSVSLFLPSSFFFHPLIRASMKKGFSQRPPPSVCCSRPRLAVFFITPMQFSIRAFAQHRRGQ